MFKLLAIPPVAYLVGLNFLETVISVNLGGIGGFIVFYVLTNFYLQNKNNENSILTTLFSTTDPSKKIKRGRRLLKIKKKIGPIPFLFFSPFLSVPVAAYLARKYFRRSTWVFFGFIIAILIWGCGACLLFSLML